MEPRETNMPGTPAPENALAFSEPQVLTRKSLAEAKRKREQEGILFPLKMTGGYARVKIPSLIDRAFLDQLPSSVQKIISDQLANESLAVRKQKQDEVAAMTGEQQLQHYMDLLEAQDDLAQRAMVLCWIQPQVVLTEAELPPDDDNVILASDVHIEDRTQFVDVLFMGEEEAVKEIGRFRREQMASVSPESAVEAPTTTIGHPAPLGTRLS